MTTTPTGHALALRRAAARIGQAIAGAALIGFHVAFTKPLRRWRTTWGATAAEAAATLPGDELVPAARWGYTHAVTIDAPPDQVWPWIVQLGQGRGGFYSYDGLENLIGCRVHNTETVLPDYQILAVGDEVWLHPKAPPLTVAMVAANSGLVLHGHDPQTADATIWAFHLHPVGDHQTRLVERGRGSYGPGLASRLAFGPTLMEPVSFVMSRKMLLTIRRLAGPAPEHS
ncbi:hypothetical protein [Rhodococcus koreensis]|uniref:Uncharacterized protein n=1 Tax=Rhodococcus koreensis TaxID=99653 RepID=A0A1H4ICJ2_9NOCA|nr:hypothetical protein [Rhodococcus koreensis]SEB30982.1 hypothetical protein SAMN04490239_0260 [Rhodococcus koreensis]